MKKKLTVLWFIYECAEISINDLSELVIASQEYPMAELTEVMDDEGDLVYALYIYDRRHEEDEPTDKSVLKEINKISSKYAPGTFIYFQG